MEERIKSNLGNDKEAKLDLRDWDSRHKKMGKGVTISSNELKALKELLKGMNK